jgi:hypothetical protein
MELADDSLIAWDCALCGGQTIGTRPGISSNPWRPSLLRGRLKLLGGLDTGEKVLV